MSRISTTMRSNWKSSRRDTLNYTHMAGMVAIRKQNFSKMEELFLDYCTYLLFYHVAPYHYVATSAAIRQLLGLKTAATGGRVVLVLC